MSFDRNQENSISMPLLDVVRKCKDKNETALCALKNNKALQIKIVVENELDTICNYNLSPYYEENVISSISGQCAPLVSKFLILPRKLILKSGYLERKNI